MFDASPCPVTRPIRALTIWMCSAGDAMPARRSVPTAVTSALSISPRPAWCCEVHPASPTGLTYTNPTFSGIELMYCSNLDTAAIFPKLSSGTTQRTAYNTDIVAASTTAGATETDSTVIDPGARYYWVNGNYLTPIYHSRRFFTKHEVMKHPNQPFTYVQVVDCWWNLFCNSRQRHGIVAPMNLAT